MVPQVRISHATLPCPLCQQPDLHSPKEVAFETRVLPKCSSAASTQLIPGCSESSKIFISNILVSFSNIAILFSEFGLLGLHLVELFFHSFYLSH